MTTFTTLAGQPFAQALAWALLHFLWQGALLALAAMALFRVFRDSASARYIAGIVTLAAMLAAPVATTMWIAARRDVAIAASAAAPAATFAAPPLSTLPMTMAEPIAAPIAPTARAMSLTSLVLLSWTLGVVVLSVRLFGGWITARRVARRVIQPTAPDVQAMVSRLAARLNLRRIVTVVESATVRVPIMIGWLKPVVILPTAVASGFTPEQVEALIVHELAHVRRHDYLVNLLQTMVETTLFYHPAVWWVSKRVRTERELCCDDVAVTICDRLVYARALSDLAEMAAPHLAMAASNGSLVERVRRILGRPSAESTSGAGWVPVFVILTLVAPVLSAPKASQPQTTVATTATAATPAPAAPVAVAASVAPTVAPQPATTAAPPQEATSRATTVEAQKQSHESEIEQVRAKLRELEEAQRDLDQKRTALEVSKSEAESRAKIEQLQSQLSRTQEELVRAQKQEQAGLAATPPVRDVEAALRQLEIQLQEVQSEREYNLAATQLDAQMAERKRDYDRTLREYELVASANGNLVGFGTDAEAITDPTEKIRDNDILMVEVPGEPDLPRVYRVQSDGTIRLPLLPAIKVVGLTTGQAGETIVKLLNDHHLVANPRVSVKLRRPR